jgi:hypothetical protein
MILTSSAVDCVGTAPEHTSALHIIDLDHLRRAVTVAGAGRRGQGSQLHRVCYVRDPPLDLLCRWGAVKTEASTLCASCGGTLSKAATECARCGRPVVHAEKTTSNVVRFVFLAVTAVTLWLSWTSVIGVSGWFARLVAALPG